MGLDYTDGCVNFRDIGAFINLILDQEVLPEKRIYRGGSIDYVETADEVENPKSVLNLRNGHDYNRLGADYYHFPMQNKVEKYDTQQKEVRVWLNQILKTFENPDLKYPVLIHCLSGKDRTGIVVAALLWTLGIDKKTIIEEYLLSEGEVNKDWINLTLQGIESMPQYFNRVAIDQVKAMVMNN